MHNPPASSKVDVIALLCAVIGLLIVLVVEAIDDITFTQDCLLYLAVFLTLDRVILHRIR